MLEADAAGKRRGTSPYLAIFLLFALAIVAIVALVTLRYSFQTFYIPSGAMEPTLRIHDVLVTNRFAYVNTSPKDGDIVVFDPPMPTGNKFIKRIIAVPGEKLRIRAGVVYRNDRVVDETFIGEKTGYDLEIKKYGIYVDDEAIENDVGNLPPKQWWNAPDRVPAHCYVLLGDNRNNSEDSHIWGFAFDGGAFTSGPRTGEKVDKFMKATRIVWPTEHAKTL